MFDALQAKLQQVIHDLMNSSQMSDDEWQELVRDRADELLLRSEEPIFLPCKTCGRVFVMRDTDPDIYASGRLILPDACPDHA